MHPETSKRPAPPKKAFCFVFEDETFQSETEFITVSEIRRIVGLAAEVPIVAVLPDGTQEQLHEDDKVELEKCNKLKKLPRFVRGFDRVGAELELLKKEFPHAERCDSGVLLHDFALPSSFVQERTMVLVPVSPAYPSAPPANFLVEWGLALRSGEALQNYSGPVTLDGKQWGQFSHRIDKGAWRPSNAPDDGDNILTYVLTVRGRLKQGA